MGHKQPFAPILAQRLLPGVKQTFRSSKFLGNLRLGPECLLSSKAAVQVARNPLFLTSAFGHKRTLTAASAAIYQVSFAICSWIASCIASFSDLNAAISPNISAPLTSISDKAFKNSTSLAPTEMGAISIFQCISSGADESELDRSVGRNLTYLEKCLCRSLWAIAKSYHGRN